MQNTNKFMRIDLQLFAEGTGGEGATGPSGEMGGNAADAMSQNGGTEPSVAGEGKPDRNAEFEKLIKEEYKDLYDARVKDIVEKRLKSTKETVKKYEELSPLLDMLGSRYGVDPSNIDALNKAIENDDVYLEDEALERGITVEQLRGIKKMERENAALKRQMEEQSRRENAAKVYAAWLKEAETVKSIYPNFDLEEEIANPDFAQLLQNNIGVRTAYEVIHKDEIISSAMQFTAQKTKEKLANSIIAGNRPAENGAGSQSSAVFKRGVASLSKEERQELARRAERGERIEL